MDFIKNKTHIFSGKKEKFMTGETTLTAANDVHTMDVEEKFISVAESPYTVTFAKYPIRFLLASLRLPYPPVRKKESKKSHWYEKFEWYKKLDQRTQQILKEEQQL